jgi:hypothetical protein
VLTRRIDAAFGRALLAFLGNDTGRVWAMAQCDFQHLVRRRHFEIQRQRDFARETVDVFIGNVASILAQVRCDAVRACVFGDMRRAQWIGMRTTARVPDRRDMIDVHTEAEMDHRSHQIHSGSM